MFEYSGASKIVEIMEKILHRSAEDDRMLFKVDVLLRSIQEHAHCLRVESNGNIWLSYYVASRSSKMLLFFVLFLLLWFLFLFGKDKNLQRIA